MKKKKHLEKDQTAKIFSKDQVPQTGLQLRRQQSSGAVEARSRRQGGRSRISCSSTVCQTLAEQRTKLTVTAAT